MGEGLYFKRIEVGAVVRQRRSGELRGFGVPSCAIGGSGPGDQGGSVNRCHASPAAVPIKGRRIRGAILA
jgi:hypothetical protein